MTSNPLLILQTLDRHLTRECELTVYGRSAIALGYPRVPPEMIATMDVDAILPASDLAVIEANDDFWRAQDLTNRELEATGLYFTHLFVDRQVILRPNWLENRCGIRFPGFRHLRLYRPATLDLVLTKMMRNDPQDREDIGFLMRQADYDALQMRQALDAAVIPDVPETRRRSNSIVNGLRPIVTNPSFSVTPARR
jgi:hypothetical protein